MQLGVPVEREFSQLRRNERAGGQPPAFDRGTQPHRPSKKIKNKKNNHTVPPKKHTQPHRHSHLTNPLKCTPTVFDTLKNVKAILRTPKTRKQAAFQLPYFQVLHYTQKSMKLSKSMVPASKNISKSHPSAAPQNP